ncbi:kelch-like protein 10 isoform X1 [Spea bombifrons]|uniref:kelch-like protein 10 isoform X1 n=1 Tax=Spea bombifrons TaxID=233779 RepID=UPI00234A038D|nr:kelch-like protein 10 isoform X1 [Spea bombifrons]
MQKRVYNIPGISPDMMELIIEYAYTRRVPVTTCNVEQLLVAADQFNIMGIVRECCAFLTSHLSFDNCIGICSLTEIYYCPELCQKAFVFILHNFENIFKTSEEFLELSVMKLSYMIERDELNINKENVVFEAILKWIDHDPEKRNQYISVLLPKVRLGLIQIAYFLNNVKNNIYVKDREDCKPIIINAFEAIFHFNMSGRSSSNFRNPLCRPRLPYNILFAIGGWSGRSPTSTIETYDSRAAQWVHVMCDEEHPRAYHGVVYLKGFIYIVGGFDGLHYFNSVKRFDPVKKLWEQVAPMHSKRCYVSVTVLQNLIYAMGGFDGYVRLNTAEQYQPETNQWTLIAPMIEQRSDASATTLSGKIYICGGFNGNECLFSAEVYNPKTDQWTMVGGFDGTNRLCSAECYSPVSNTWLPLPSMLSCRSNFGIEVVDDLIYVIGGFNGFTTTFKVEYYDEKTREWYDAKDMSIYRSALSCCVVPGLPNIQEYCAPRNKF